MKHFLTCITYLSLTWATCGAAFAQEGKAQACPTVSVSCPDNPSGKAQSYKAQVSGGDPVVKPTYIWKVSGGKIIGGQGTKEVTVDAEGLNSLTVMVEVGGYAASCRAASACTWFVCPAPLSRKVDEFEGLTPGQEEARLDAFAKELWSDPSAQGYIIVYAGSRGSKREAEGRAGRMRSYLVRRHGLEPDRVVSLPGGKRKALAVELWVVPAGAAPPQPTPSLAPRAKHNNGMHPTVNSIALMRETCFNSAARRGG